MPKIMLVKAVDVSTSSWSEEIKYELFRAGSNVIWDVTEDEAKVLEKNIHCIEYDVSVIRVLEEQEKFKDLLEKCQERQIKLDEALKKQQMEYEAQRRKKEKDKIKSQQDKEIHERRLLEELKKKYELQSATAFSSVIDPFDGSELKTEVVNRNET